MDYNKEQLNYTLEKIDLEMTLKIKNFNSSHIIEGKITLE